MAIPDYALRTMGFPASALKDEVTTQIIRDTASNLQQLPHWNLKTCIVEAATKLLSVMGEAQFSPLWIVLLDKLSVQSHDEEVATVYSRINEKQAELLTVGSLPLPVLHKLWLSHLPCLEFAVLTLIRYLCCGQRYPFPGTIQSALQKSHLVKIASREPLIYRTVFCMLDSLADESDYPDVIIDTTALFCHMTRDMTESISFQSQIKVNPAIPEYISQLESFLRMCPENIPALSVWKSIQRIHTTWINHKSTDRPHVIDSEFGLSQCPQKTSSYTSDEQVEMLWRLIMQYRPWMISALQSILSCDQQYIQACFWIIAISKRLNSQEFKAVETSFDSFIKHLRGLLKLKTLLVISDLQHLVTSLTEEIQNVMESDPSLTREKKEFYRRSCTAVMNQLLMVFLFQSNTSFSTGQQLLALVADSQDVFEHVKCLVYHYQFLNINPKQWSRTKHKSFQSFVSELKQRLNKESNFQNHEDCDNMFEELSQLLEDVK